MEAQQAESPKAIFRLHGLINNLLQVSPTAQIKYKGIRDALAANMKKFGPELLSKHFENVEVAHLAGRAADSVLVLLKHWRRITSSPAAWERFGRKVEEAQLQVLMPLYKCTEKDPVKPRILKKEFSEVTVGSDGFPAMLATSGSESQSEASIPESLAHSPPPVLKKDWRSQAGRELKKKPAGKEVAQSSKKVEKGKAFTKGMKRPSSMVSHKSGKEEEKAKSKAGGPDTVVDVATLSLGGGKKQTYIQHQPNGKGTPKRLIVACTIQQASSLTISHKQLVEELIPHCKKPGATKGSILEARANLIGKYKK